jgi:predicted Zn finger-like uncharacterized protein
MHLTCPSCGATFLVEPEQLGPSGRRVRCGECDHTWHQERPSDAEAAEKSAAKAAAKPFAPIEAVPAEPAAEQAAAALAPEPAAERASAAPLREPAEAGARIPRRAHSKPPSPLRKPRESSLAAGWIAFLIVVTGLAAGFYFGRAQLVAMVPRMTRLYDLVGLAGEPDKLGLELRNVKSVRRLVDGKRVVVIEGVVANVSGQLRKVPLLRATLTDAEGAELDHWTFEAAEKSLPPGGTAGFETIAKDPPREGNLSIDFVAED